MVLGFNSISTSAIVSLSAVFTFFLGFAVFTSHVYLPSIALVAVYTLTIVLSYYSRHPLGGVIIALLFVATFILGYFSFECIQVSINPAKGSSTYPARQVLEEIYRGNPWGAALSDTAGKWVFIFLTTALSLSEYGRLLSIISATLALASMGFLSGLIGYIQKRFMPSTPETHPFVFRDYWSQIYGWRKSHKTEHRNLDRKLAGWSVRKGSLRQRIRRKMTEPEPELLFLPKASSISTKDLTKGNLYFHSSEEAIGEFVDYNKLVSKYKPQLIFYSFKELKDLKKFADTFKEKSGEKKNLPLKSKGLLSFALEGLTTKLVDKIVKSRAIILLFFSLALAFTFWIVGHVLYHEFPLEYAIVSILAVALPSAITFVLANRFWQGSKELIRRRPDERALMLAIYLCLLLVFPTIVILGFNLPTEMYFNVPPPPSAETWLLIPPSWFQEFLWWALPFAGLSVILGLGYIFIHRETETINTYFFDNRPEEKVDPRLKPFNNPREIPWIAEDTKTEFFWVIRFMYYWRFEVTLPLPHSDWERVELWIDAKTSVLKWIVSDYHYRELWYEVKDPVEKPLSDLYVRIVTNFHTPIPVIDYDEAKIFSKALGQGTYEEKPVSVWQLLKIGFSGLFRKTHGTFDSETEKTIEAVPTLKEISEWENIHSENPIKGANDVVSKFLDVYPYKKMRYKYGVNWKKVKKPESKSLWNRIKKFFEGKETEKEELQYETLHSTAV